MANKIALVTGGSRGLGKDMALRLAEKGLDIVLTYNSKAEEAQAVVDQIRQAGQKATALQLNTGDVKNFEVFVAKFKEVLSNTFSATHFDYLINNAGVGGIMPIPDVTEAFFDEMMNVHFKGVVFLTQQLLPILNDNGGIVNISSGLTRVSFPGSSVYASFKGAVEVFTRYLAKELGGRGIRANVIAPGAVATDFNGAHLRNNEQTRKAVSSVTALGRTALADDIGGVVAFLCTEDAKWISGQRIEVSGGLLV
jgi:NAD(P)-dependent dehydrogenase (short-subunit alcohol dehydrogenase family)